MDGQTVYTNYELAIVFQPRQNGPPMLNPIWKVNYLNLHYVMQDKPKAYQSPLWPHLDEIRKWRLARETWEAIADKLFTLYSLKFSLQGVQAFFKRATRPDRRHPLGFGTEPSTSIAIQTIVTMAQGPDSIYEEARKAIREEQQSRPKIIKPDRLL